MRKGSCCLSNGKHKIQRKSKQDPLQEVRESSKGEEEGPLVTRALSTFSIHKHNITNKVNNTDFTWHSLFLPITITTTTTTTLIKVTILKSHLTLTLNTLFLFQLYIYIYLLIYYYRERRSSHNLRYMS